MHEGGDKGRKGGKREAGGRGRERERKREKEGKSKPIGAIWALGGSEM